LPIYTYRARDESGKAVSGKLEAASSEALADRLAHLGYIVTAIKENPTPIVLDNLFASFQRVKINDMVMYTTQLASMIGAGLTLPAGLKILAEQIENHKLKTATIAIFEDIKEGVSFSSALKKHPDIFSELFINMVASGEVSGNLEDVLRQLAKFLEKESELKQKVTTALFYPVILVVMGVVIIVFIVTAVLPAFVKIFLDAKVPLPLPTLIIYNTNLFLRAWWHVFIGSLVAIFIFLRWFNQTPTGKITLDTLKFHFPIWGSIVKQVTIARFARTLAALLSSGISMLQALETTERTVGNSIISQVLRGVYQSVAKGESLARTLRESKVFPPMAVQMIAVGEETGSLEQLLNKIADFYEMSTDYTLKRVTALIEPLFLIVIGGMVAFIFASILLPIFRMVSTLRH
jgi:type IV pilus assembly protein PilC